ncbi:hypothetical protein AAF712_011800 [Marasmius tenuissimus]|uniref:Uncharacterized protein n=1 Tax=Marasmius tenuissimus TaxID=585030 RepID=A0ABR2ZJM1_9AGAR
MSLVRVDDSDTSTLSYANGGQGWRRSDRADTAEYLATSHGSSVSGASVTLRFNGTTVEVKGTVFQDKEGSNKKSTATFVLDQNGQNPFQFERKPSSNTLYQQTLYSNSSLQADMEHTLVMSLNDPDYRLWLDYIEYTPMSSAADASPVSSAKIEAPPASSAASEIPPVSSVASNGATATNEPQSNTDNKGVSTGLVAGVSVAAAILTTLIVIGFWWLRREKHMKQDSEEPATFFTYPSNPNTVAPMVQHEFSQGKSPLRLTFVRDTNRTTGRVQPYPTAMNPSGGLATTQFQYVPSQYSSATSASGTDQEQLQEIGPELPPYRKAA